MLELLSRPLIIVFWFGIEVNEALRVGGSRFLGESDAGEAELSGFFKEFHGTFSKSRMSAALPLVWIPFCLFCAVETQKLFRSQRLPLVTRSGPSISSRRI